jgi:hypothetical protein
MAKEFKDTTLGKFIDRFSDTGEIGSMNHSIETKSILIFGAVVIGAGVVLMVIKKYIFK